MSTIYKTLDGVAYEIHELKLRDCEDLFGKEGTNFSQEVFKRAVHVNGAPVGDAAPDLPLRHYMTLMKAVVTLNQAQEEAGNE